MQVKVDVQLRCNACDTVLSTSMVALEDKDGFYAYVDLCPKCAAQQGVQADKCPTCAGSGSYDTMETIEKCPACNGTGIRG